MAKRPSGGATSESSERSKRIDPKWASDFPWVVIVDSEGEGMLCGPCGKNNRHPGKVPVAIFRAKIERARVR